MDKEVYHFVEFAKYEEQDFNGWSSSYIYGPYKTKEESKIKAELMFEDDVLINIADCFDLSIEEVRENFEAIYFSFNGPSLITNYTNLD